MKRKKKGNKSQKVKCQLEQVGEERKKEAGRERRK